VKSVPIEEFLCSINLKAMSTCWKYTPGIGVFAFELYRSLRAELPVISTREILNRKAPGRKSRHSVPPLLEVMQYFGLYRYLKNEWPTSG
jgi:hypothetical protein